MGNRFIEGMAGLWCAGLGFGDAELIDAAKAQLDRLPYYHLFGGRTHEPAIELAEKIKDMYPRQMARVFYCSSGSEANARDKTTSKRCRGVQASARAR